MEIKFKDKICNSGYYGLVRILDRSVSKYHIAHFERPKVIGSNSNNCRMYLCGCNGRIRISTGFLFTNGKRYKKSNFQKRMYERSRPRGFFYKK